MQNTVEAEPLAISLPEAARRVGLSRANLWARAMSGELPTVKVGGRRLVRLTTLEAWLAHGEIGDDESAAPGHLPEAARRALGGVVASRPG